MQAVDLFSREELEGMEREELIRGYLALKESFLEHLAREAEQDRLIKNLVERQNRDNEKRFGRSTETNASLSEPKAEKNRNGSSGEGQSEKDSLDGAAEPGKRDSPNTGPDVRSG